MRPVSKAVSILFLLSVFALHAQTRVRVTQESSPGSGNFNSNVLGYVDVFERSGESITDVYAFDTVLSGSYGGTNPSSIPATTELFVVRTSEGVVLFTVHGAPDGGVGNVQMRYELSGDPSGAARLFEDDPGDTGRTGNLFGPTLFQTHHRFWGPRSDGVVIGALDAHWSMLASFADIDSESGNEAVGVTAWVIASAGGSSIPLSMELDRRVRLDAVATVMIRIAPANGVNPRNAGTIPVRIMSTEHFDAPTMVDQSSLTFGRTGDEHSLAYCSGAPPEVERNGTHDLVCHFNTRQAGFQSGDSVGILRGMTTAGVNFEGSDTVRIVPSRP